MSTRMNQWFIPGEGIAREVITADIQRYLGPDALVKPGTGTGEYEGRQGYWITAYRTLTSQMLQDLRNDSLRWQAEKDPKDQRGGVAYQDSRTHAQRQYTGPTQADYSASSKPTYSTQQYAPSESPHYTTTSTAAYPSHPYQQTAQHPAAPRTDPTYYQHAGHAQHPQHQAYGQTPAPVAYQQYAQPPATDMYGRSPVQYSTQRYFGFDPSPFLDPVLRPTSVVAAPGYYIASDGRQYPLAQQPQPPPGGRRR